MYTVKNTKNNHLRYWYNNDPEQRYRLDDLETTTMSVGGCSRPIGSFRDELLENASDILTNYPDLVLFMSGGLDSEMAFRIFQTLGKIPPIKIVRFPNDENWFDIKYAVELLNELNISYEYIDFDLVDFYHSGECWEIANKYQAYTVYQQMLLKIADELKQPMITIDEIELVKYPRVDWSTGKYSFEWTFLKREDQDAVWRRFAAATSIPALNNFYTYSPESMLAFLKIPLVQDLINDRIPGKLGWNSSKNQIYTVLEYPFRSRPKYGGIERYPNIWEIVKASVNLHGLEFTPRDYAVNVHTLEQNLINNQETQCQVA